MWKSLGCIMLNGVPREVPRTKTLGACDPLGFGLGTSLGTLFTHSPSAFPHIVPLYRCTVHYTLHRHQSDWLREGRREKNLIIFGHCPKGKGAPCIVPRVSGHPHSAQESTEMRSLHRRGRETKKFIFLSSSRLCLMGWGSSSLEILQVCS